MTSIGVDIDDTLTSFQDTARSVFIDVALEQENKRYQRGAYCAWGEWRSPADVTDDEVWPMIVKRCHTPEYIAVQEPFPHAASTLQELADQGYRLHYISNRSPDVAGVTDEWLEACGFPDGTLTCCLTDKLPLLHDCQYLLDDRPRTLVEFVYDFHWKHKHGSANASMARKAFGLYMPYNAALTDVPLIKLAPNWKLLRQYLIEQSVLTERITVGPSS